MIEQLHIRKASGDLVPFDEDRLKRSLERCGAGEELMNQIVEEIKMDLFEGMPTKIIYRKAFKLLRKKSHSTAAKYKLKRAIIELGPTGYPFEQFVGELLKYQGYDVEVGVSVKGHCVSHEVDVVAKNRSDQFMVECKFHSDQNRRCGVQVPLYIESRFNDIHREWRKRSGKGKSFKQGWIVTNTRFSEDAVQYGNCVGLTLIGWDQPRNGSLKERIDISGLHPITCLSSLSKNDKQNLLDQNIVLCKQVCENEQTLLNARIERKKHTRILKEIEQLFSGT